MVFSKEPFVKIEKYLPIQRKKATIDNYVFLSAILYLWKMVVNGERYLKNMETGTPYTCALADGAKTGVYSVFLKPCKKRA